MFLVTSAKMRRAYLISEILNRRSNKECSIFTHSGDSKIPGIFLVLQPLYFFYITRFCLLLFPMSLPHLKLRHNNGYGKFTQHADEETNGVNLQHLSESLPSKNPRNHHWQTKNRKKQIV